MNNHPKHIIAVSAYITNGEGDALLVKTHNRSDTWESPGGQVEEGEALDKAVYREVFEETGVKINVLGITGIYYNATKHLMSVVFKANVDSGLLNIQPEEIKEAAFVPLSEENINEYITRPHMKSRTLDAMNADNYIPYETWEVNPYQMMGRLDP
ncbi:NUDIX hydrolase [Pontibacillus sp. HMF3514]|uniref:NUDIX hydrolase n=1 Tax=Pontibacillus sp. HMF3514 TaxID=2692425 RepID=UPI00131FA844|nr:NUDIX hydrolase [Pontibacillus sp. HMF3514]QHE52679.1 NUDIX domain-containing protein [Pontibacillus sp. HMF3514]